MGIKKLAPLVAAAALAGTFVFATAAQADYHYAYNPDTSRIYRITTSNSLALDVQGASTADDAPVIQWGVNGGTNQEWTFVAGRRGAYEIVNRNSGKCLSVYYNSLSAGANLVQYTCNNWDDQLWWIGEFWGSITLQSVSSYLYASVPGDTPVWGTQLIQWPYGDFDAAEAFHLTALA